MDTRYVWLDRVRVQSDGIFSVYCLVGARRVPLPFAILHPDCTLREVGDVGALGVPEHWAILYGLLPPPEIRDVRHRDDLEGAMGSR